MAQALPFIRVSQVAEDLQVHRRTVTKWLETGKLRGVNPTGWWRIFPDDYVEFRKKFQGGDVPTPG